MNSKTKLHHRTLALIAFLLFLVSQTKTAQADLKPELRAAIMLKVLSFDSMLADKSSALQIAIATDEASAQEYTALRAAFRKVAAKNITVLGRKVAVSKAGADLSGIDVLFVPAAYEDIFSIMKSAKSRRIPVVCGNASHLRKGAAIAIASSKGKPLMMVSRSGAKGIMRLNPKLLRLATIVP